MTDTVPNCEWAFIIYQDSNGNTFTVEIPQGNDIFLQAEHGINEVDLLGKCIDGKVLPPYRQGEAKLTIRVRQGSRQDGVLMQEGRFGR